MCAKYDQIQAAIETEIAETELETVMGGTISHPKSEPVTNIEGASNSPQTGARSSSKPKPENKTF
jgi:hypothetical protein